MIEIYYKNHKKILRINKKALRTYLLHSVKHNGYCKMNTTLEMKNYIKQELEVCDEMSSIYIGESVDPLASDRLNESCLPYIKLYDNVLTNGYEKCNIPFSDEKPQTTAIKIENTNEESSTSKNEFEDTDRETKMLDFEEVNIKEEIVSTPTDFNAICLSSRNSQILTHHRRKNIQAGEKCFSCEICEYKSPSKDNLRRHLTIHTENKPFACDICDYKCTAEARLRNHMRTHTGEKPFACKMCDYKCSANSNLWKHMKTHTGEKPYSCEICHYKCIQKADLKKHSTTHTGEKPFECETCGNKFSRRNDRRRHMKIHTGEKSLACGLCEYKCSENISLQNHLRTHTGMKPFECKQCDYKCSAKTNLLRHMKMHNRELLNARNRNAVENM